MAVAGSPPGQGPEATILSDGQNHYLASSMFSQFYTSDDKAVAVAGAAATGGAATLPAVAVAGAAATGGAATLPAATLPAVAVAGAAVTGGAATLPATLPAVAVAGAAAAASGQPSVAGAALVSHMPPGVQLVSQTHVSQAAVAPPTQMPPGAQRVGQGGVSGQVASAPAAPLVAGAAEDGEETSGSDTDSEEQALVAKLAEVRKRKQQQQQQQGQKQRHQQQGQQQGQQQQKQEFQNDPEGTAAHIKDLERQLQDLHRVEHLQRQIKRTQSRIGQTANSLTVENEEPGPSSSAGASEGAPLISVLGSNRRKSKKADSETLNVFRPPNMDAGMRSPAPASKRARGMSPPVKLEISSDEEPPIKKETQDAGAGVARAAPANVRAAPDGVARAAPADVARAAAGSIAPEDRAEIVRDEEGRPWVCSQRGKRRLSRASSGGYDDPVVLVVLQEGKPFQMVCSQSGFGKRYDVARLLTPPPPAPAGEEPSSSSWILRMRPVIPLRSGPSAPGTDGTVADRSVARAADDDKSARVADDDKSVAGGADDKSAARAVDDDKSEVEAGVAASPGGQDAGPPTPLPMAVGELRSPPPSPPSPAAAWVNPDFLAGMVPPDGH